MDAQVPENGGSLPRPSPKLPPPSREYMKKVHDHAHARESKSDTPEILRVEKASDGEEHWEGSGSHVGSLIRR
mgnify:CR=1 FL=1